MPIGLPKVGNLLRCPYCGNESEFFEITDDVITTTHYIQTEVLLLKTKAPSPLAT